MTATLERETAASAPQASTEQQASGSSFYAAMRLLPPPERAAMFAIYAFCRLVDDIADEPGPTTQQRALELGAWRADLAALYAGAPPPRIQFLAEHVSRFGLTQADFLAIRSSRRPTTRSTSTATGWPARLGGCRCASSACRRPRAWNSPSTSAARCS
jgi:phytoene/squalene synthetase